MIGPVSQLLKFKNRSPDPMFHKYRREWDQGNTLINFALSIMKLIILILLEIFRYKISQTYCSKITSLEATNNHLKASKIIKKMGIEFESVGYKLFCETNYISFLGAYIGGLNSIPFAFYYCFIRRGRYRKIVSKKLDFFILSNTKGKISLPANTYSGRKYILLYSELSPYQHLALDAYHLQGYVSVFIPHSIIPDCHPSFRSRYILTEGKKSAKNFIEIDGLYSLINMGSFNPDIKPDQFSVLIGMNYFDNLSYIRKVIRNILSNGRKNNFKITIRFHPATKLVFFKYLVLMLISLRYLKLDNQPLLESLQKNKFIVAGFSGILIDALRVGRLAFTWADPVRVSNFFNIDVKEINSVEFFPCIKSAEGSLMFDSNKSFFDFKVGLNKILETC